MKRLLRIILVTCAAVLLVATALGRSGSASWPLELFSNFPMQLAAAAAVVMLVALLLRARVSLAIALVVFIVNGAVVVGTLDTDRRAAEPGAQHMTFAHLNAQGGHIDANGLRSYVTRERPAVFIVLDPAPFQVKALRQSPVGYTVYTTKAVFGIDRRATRTVVWSRINIAGVRHPTDFRFGPTAVEFTFRLDGVVCPFLDFGSQSPLNPPRAGRRNRTLDAAARWSLVQRHAGHGRRVVMGDLDATPWSPVFDELLHDGKLHSSLDGYGIQPSWPVTNPFLRIPIDHALLSAELTATDRGLGPSFGSEHRSLHVTVAVSKTD